MPEKLRIAFVTNFCSHYRVKTFENLARCHNIDYYFYSPGDEWYWRKEHGTHAGDFRYEYLNGFRIGRTRVVPSLLAKLWRGKYDVYVKCINGRFALPATYVVARIRRKPFVLWTGIWMTLQTWFHRLVFPLTRYIYRHADALVVYGEHVKRYLIEQGVPAEKIFVAPHAIDNAAYSGPVGEAEVARLRTKFALSASERVVLFLGRLEKVKGLPHLLEGFAQVGAQDVVLLMAGEGSERVALLRRARQLGLQSRVRFAGYVPPEEARPLLALAHVLVLPSVTTPQGKEPWGLVVNEAMNQAVPVIVTEAVGAAAGGLVQNGINGIVVPERDSGALSRALNRLLDDYDLHFRLSQNARRTIMDWNQEKMVGGFCQAIAYVRPPVDATATAPRRKRACSEWSEDEARNLL